MWVVSSSGINAYDAADTERKRKGSTRKVTSKYKISDRIDLTTYSCVEVSIGRKQVTDIFEQESKSESTIRIRLQMAKAFRSRVMFETNNHGHMGGMVLARNAQHWRSIVSNDSPFRLFFTTDLMRGWNNLRDKYLDLQTNMEYTIGRLEIGSQHVFLPVDNEGHRFVLTFDLKYGAGTKCKDNIVCRRRPPTKVWTVELLSDREDR
ncbi:hypothetical protein Tco_1017909 [Tanacetum coccineum]|uniref:Uncharacterized protein n=1 Tax=Tanacetum coccineum TaxID=301880 RepID=A0ABQ5FT81_9ASTR